MLKHTTVFTALGVWFLFHIVVFYHKSFRFRTSI